METQTRIDQKISEIIQEQYNRATALLQANTPKLHEIAKYLYEHETITGEEFMQILNRPQITHSPLHNKRLSSYFPHKTSKTCFPPAHCRNGKQVFCCLE